MLLLYGFSVSLLTALFLNTFINVINMQLAV